MKYFVLFIISLNLKAWTFSSSLRHGYYNSSIDIYISSNDCTNAGLDTAEIKSLVEDASTLFWNTVSTSSLKLNYKGIINSSTSSDTLNAAINRVSNNQIIVGCSQDATLFTSNSILGVGTFACAGNDCRGAVLMNDKSGTNLSSSSRDTILAAFAHELGHALGLGHSSVEESLMYYDLTGKTMKALNQDDIDGITYLYPNEKKLSGLAGACGSIDTNPKNNSQFFISLFLGFFGVYLWSQKRKLLHTFSGSRI